MKKLYDEIFKFDSAGKIRTWRMEQDGPHHRTIAGIKKGKLVESEWTLCMPTNVGRSNERSATEQATFEIEAAYANKLAREYHKDIAGAGDGAHFFKPMLAEKYVAFEPGYAQPKLDGIRCIAMAKGMFSREGKPITTLKHIEAALEPLFAANPDLILDGEIYTHEFKDDFNAIVSAVKREKPTDEQIKQVMKTQYWVYDIPSHKGSFRERARELFLLLTEQSRNCLVVVETVPVNSAEAYDTFHGQWLEAGYEGSMHRLDAPYANRRTKALKKRKEFIDEEFELVRIEEGVGNWAGVAKRAVCRLKDGREFGAGIKGNKARAVELLHEKHNVVTVKYFNRTPDGIPRFPVAIKFHGYERTL